MKFVLLLCAVIGLNAQTSNPLSHDVQVAYASTKSNIIRSAEKMPEGDYNFRPAARVRTFGELLGHVAQEQYLFFCGPWKGENKAVDIEKTVTSKSDLVAAVKASFAYCDPVYENVTDAAAAEIVNTGGNRSTRLRLLWMNIAHDELHYGNMVTYLRIKGIVPPSTEGQ